MKTKEIRIGDGKMLRCLVAENTRERTRGLLGREGLESGVFMWLSPCNMIHTIGMRFAIDLVFIDKRNRVVKVMRGIRPGRMAWGGWKARTTLEAQSDWLPEIPVGATLESL